MRKTPEGLNIPDGPVLEKIVRELGSFTVALFGVDKSGGRFCGSGTLVSVSSCRYILTAAHVWEYLKRYPNIHVTLMEKVHHSFGIDRETIEPIGTVKPKDGWGEWGPDVCFLRLPPHNVGVIEAHRTFYNLGKERHQPGRLEWWALMGSPEVCGKFTDTGADFRITGSFLGVIARHDNDGLDYLDIGVDLSLEGAPESFAGISGGGLWRLVFTETTPGEFSWNYAFRGVAFYQSPVAEGHRFVRCHGLKSIQRFAPEGTVALASTRQT